MLTQGQVEEELDRLSRLLEQRTDEYARAVVAAANADTEYQKRHDLLAVHEANKVAATGVKVTTTEREFRVRIQCQDELAVKNIKAAQAEGLKQILYSLRTQINALQTVSANIRAQT